jgi:hypothetical protein
VHFFLLQQSFINFFLNKFTPNVRSPVQIYLHFRNGEARKMQGQAEEGEVEGEPSNSFYCIFTSSFRAASFL